MIDFIVFTSLVCTGIFVCTWQGMIFYNLTIYYDRIKYQLIKSKRFYILGEFLNLFRNTLFGCMYCMSSFWSIVIYLTDIYPIKLFMLPFAAWGVCGCNAIVFAVIRYTVPGYNKEIGKD